MAGTVTKKLLLCPWKILPMLAVSDRLATRHEVEQLMESLYACAKDGQTFDAQDPGLGEKAVVAAR